MRKSACVVACGLALLNGCATWRRQPLDARELLATRHEMAIRVHTDDGQTIVVPDPRIIADRLYGTIRREPVQRDLADVFPQEIDSVNVALARIVAVDIHRISILHTVGGIVSVAAVSVGFLWLTDRPQSYPMFP